MGSNARAERRRAARETQRAESGAQGPVLFPRPATDALDGARMAAEVGLRVLPVRPIDAKHKPGKAPALVQWQRLATEDLNKISRWDEAGYGFGAMLGEAINGGPALYVVDIDTRDGGTFKAAGALGLRTDCIVRTGEGSHVYLYGPPGLRGRKLGPGIELRGIGQYVVLPGSPHVSGKVYQVASIALPEWLRPELVGGKAPQGGPGGLPDAESIGEDDPRIAEAREAARRSVDPARDRSGFEHACGKELRARGVSLGQVRTVLEADGPKTTEREPRYLVTTLQAIEEGFQQQRPLRARKPAKMPETERAEAEGVRAIHVVDVVDLAAAMTADRPPFVIEDLQEEAQILALFGEEGDGKTMFGEQGSRQLLRREPLFDCFEPGVLAPARILYLDTHQEPPEVGTRQREMERRGLVVPRGTLAWGFPLGSLALTDGGQSKARLLDALDEARAEYLWVDSAHHLVRDATEDAEVRELFQVVREVARTAELRGVTFTLFPRKRPTGPRPRDREFDDLFGSREWKGEASRVLFIEGSRIVCPKDRGGWLRRRWGVPPGERHPRAILERPGLDDPRAVPFRIRPLTSPDERPEEKALRLLHQRPDHYTRTTLAQVLGGNYGHALAVVARLLEEGRIGPDRDRAKLRVAPPIRIRGGTR